MKLRNKKTGEIGNLALNINPNRESYSVLSTENGDTVCGNLVIADYNSLAELNEEWEDCEEPKEYWFINDLDGKPMKCELRYCPVRDFTEWSEKRKQLGNYFETREEAEKAVEKLKAWKRLKERGFKFKTVYRNPQGSYNIYANFEGYIPPSSNDINIDLKICFGGEE